MIWFKIHKLPTMTDTWKKVSGFNGQNTVTTMTTISWSVYNKDNSLSQKFHQECNKYFFYILA